MKDARAKANSSLLEPGGGRLTVYADGGNVSVPLSPALAKACVLACGLAPAEAGADADADEAGPAARALKCSAYSDKTVRDLVVPYLRAARRAASRPPERRA